MEQKYEKQLAAYQELRAKEKAIKEKLAPMVDALKAEREQLSAEIVERKERIKKIDADLKEFGQAVPRKKRANGGKVKETIEKLLDDGQEHDNDSILNALGMTKQTGYVGEVLKGLIDEKKIVRVRKGVYQKKA